MLAAASMPTLLHPTLLCRAVLLKVNYEYPIATARYGQNNHRTPKTAKKITLSANVTQFNPFRQPHTRIDSRTI